MSTILGISFGFHDSAVAVVKDGIVVAAASEERFSGIKNDDSFPHKAIDFCLNFANVAKPDIIAFYENPYLKLDRKLTFALEENSKEYILECLSQLKKLNFDQLSLVEQKFSIKRDVIAICEHHTSHAASAFFASSYQDAAVLVMDGVGEYATTSIYKAQNNKLDLLWQLKLPFSIGLLYTAFTHFLGFEVNEGEYKVMGMAGFGKPIYANKLKQFITYDFENDNFKIDDSLFEFKTPITTHLKPRFFEIFGESRVFNKKFVLDNSEDGIKNQYYADIAASLQSVVEEIIEGLAKKALEMCKIKTLCIAGGVGLNSAANGRLRRNLDLDGFYIQPASGDAGGAIGAALYAASLNGHDFKNKEVMKYDLGKSYTKEQIKNAIDSFLITEDEFEIIENKDEYCKKVASLIANNKIIGWLWGRFEFGPRALGRRSILANPTHPKMKDTVNEKIKYRELFRPFAPSVLAEKAHEWFAINEIKDKNAPERYMLAIAPVLDDKKETLPAITHIDGTARIHLVDDDGSMYRTLIENIEKENGVPITLNTSFNLRGEPIVSTPEDALRTFIQCEIDALAMYPYIIYRGW